MAMSITVGYDFAPTEVPTKELLELMTAGMSVTGIDISQISANLVGTKTEDSNVSLPGEGWMWRDPMGALWVNTRNGRCRFFRACWGGWETNRYPVGNPLQTFSLPISHVTPIGRFQTATVAESNESDIYFRVGTSQIRQQIAKGTETLVSGTAQPVVVRGAYYAENLSADRQQFPDYMISRAAGQNEQPVETFPMDGGSLAPTMFGTMWRNNISTSRSLAWYYALEMQTQ